MEKLYWFTDENGENIINDLYGTFEEAEIYAQEWANIYKCEICINCGDNIVDFVYPN